jgi:hypothetical protein
MLAEPVGRYSGGDGSKDIATERETSDQVDLDMEIHGIGSVPWVEADGAIEVAHQLRLDQRPAVIVTAS